MNANEIKGFLIENPKYKGILKRAVECEEENTKKEHYLGWEWHDVRAYPAELMKLVREGIIRIRFKSNRYTNYILTDIEATKRALETQK